LANTRKGNVLIIDTAAEFNEVLRIKGVKVVNANAGSQTSTIEYGGSSGTVAYTKTLAATSESFEEVKMRFTYGDQCYVTPGTDCTVYLYIE
jgi:hypothetical protein